MSSPAMREPKEPTHANDDALQINPDEIRQFLSFFNSPTGRVIASLTKGAPGVMRARYFGPDQLAEASQYAAEEAARQKNIYHLPAQFASGLSGGKPPEKQDIVASHYLWVDFDPKEEGDPAAERERFLGRLTVNRAHDVPAPTGIINSGNGIHAYWATNDPMTPEQTENKNRWLVRALGGDRCAFNASRLLRVAGTINEPTETKLRKGRVRQKSSIVSWDQTLVHPSSLFPELAVGDAKTRQNKSKAPETPLAFRTVTESDLDELGIPASLRALIVTGTDPVDPSRFDGDRSRAVFSAVTSLVKRGVDDNTIYSIILDENYGLSQHTRDQSNPEACARRQIERAKLLTADPALAEMNERHAVIKSVGGRCMVTRWVPSPLDPSKNILQLQTTAEFEKTYMHEMAGPPDRQQPKGRWWLRHPKRREYDNIIFCPGEPEEIGTSLNLWMGFNISAVPGDWSLLRNHILEVLAGGDPAYAEDITRWAAWAVQNPGRPAEVALVLRGGRGTGKGTFGSVLRSIFGRHALQLSSSKHVAGNFNAHLRDICFLFSDESYFPGSKGDEGTLKRLLTEETIFIEAKGQDGEEHPNRLHVLMASNDAWVVPAGIDERRFAVYEVAERWKQNAQYFAALHDQLENGGKEAFLYELLNMDLGSWHPRQMRPTTALMDQKLSSLLPEDEFVLQLLQQGHLGPTAETADADTNGNLKNYAAQLVPRMRDVTANRLGRALTKHGCSEIWIRKEKGKRFPPLDEARAAFERYVGGPIAWESPDQKVWGNAPQIDDDYRTTDDLPF